jgi:hypothetical protein
MNALDECDAQVAAVENFMDELNARMDRMPVASASVCDEEEATKYKETA